MRKVSLASFQIQYSIDLVTFCDGGIDRLSELDSEITSIQSHAVFIIDPLQCDQVYITLQFPWLSSQIELMYYNISFR